MSRRTIEAYTAGLKFVHQNLIELRGAGIIFDFELAMRAALKTIAPDLPVYGCLFHYMQALQRMMTSMTTLFNLIRSNQDAKFVFRKFQALALLPANMVKDGFVSLLREALEKFKFSEFAPFIDYYKKQWINRVKPEHFSVYKLETRTTGSAEAFNGKINKSFRTHGAFYHFVESLQKEETVKADQFSRDVDGTLQPDRRKKFFKKRSELISKYWSELEKKVVTPKHFVSIMANINNEILCDEKIMFTSEKDVEISNETTLMEGEDVTYVLPDFNDDKREEVAPTQRTTRKKKTTKLNTLGLAVDNEKQTARNAGKVSESVDQQTQPQRATRKRKAAEPPIETIESVTTKRTRRNHETISALSKTTERTNRTEQNHDRTNEPNSNDDSVSDADSDSRIYEIMNQISHNGPAMLNLRKKMDDLARRRNVRVNSKSSDCIICCERKKSIILFPCLHQHTCGPCWIMWKIQQVNSIDESSIDEMIRPNCPVCKKTVDDFRNAKN